MKKIFLVLFFGFFFSGNAYADEKSSFADTLRDKVYAIDDAWWINDNLSASIEIGGSWSGADTYRLAEVICDTLKEQGFTPISSYSVTMVEVTGQSKLLTLVCE